MTISQVKHVMKMSNKDREDRGESHIDLSPDLGVIDDLFVHLEDIVVVIIIDGNVVVFSVVVVVVSVFCCCCQCCCQCC